MKKTAIIFLMLICLFMFAACDGNDTVTTTESPTEETTLSENTTEDAGAEKTTAENSAETTTFEADETEPVTQSAGEKALNEFRKQMTNENYLCGVAYLGYYSEDFEAFVKDIKDKGIYEKHPLLNEVKSSDFYSLEGSELYAIVPAEGVSVTVNEYAFDENGIGKAKKKIAETDAAPLFIRGNISDIMPNIQIIITDKNGNLSEYLPSMSLETGYLSKGQQIWDFSPYDLLGGHFENNIFEEDMPTFIGSWWGEYEVGGEVYSLTAEFKENGEATYGYGYGNSEILEYFEGSWYKEDSDTINIVMYGGPDSFDGSEMNNTEKYELNGIFDWGCTDTNEMFLTHISGGVLLYGTEGEKFHFDKIVEEE